MILNISYRFLIFAFVAALLFIIFPGIDLYFTSLFYEGGEFYLKDNLLAMLVYDYGPSVAGVFVLAVLLVYVYMLVKKKVDLFGIKKGCYLFLLLAMLVGPLITVNLIMKEVSGRARPRNVVQFGGERQFTPAFIISDQCSNNCSFVSGHASAGFYFVALSLIFKGRRRRIIFWSSVAAGGFIGLVRVVQGGHFFSDVVFSFVFVYLASLLLHYFMFKDEYPSA